MNNFYEHLMKDCNIWYEYASNQFSRDAHSYASIIKNVGTHKHIIMHYAHSEFHEVKGDLLNIADSFIDSQKAIESTYNYWNRRIKYMDKTITEPSWKYELKYSTPIIKRCLGDARKV